MSKIRFPRGPALQFILLINLLAISSLGALGLYLWVSSVVAPSSAIQVGGQGSASTPNQPSQKSGTAPAAQNLFAESNYALSLIDSKEKREAVRYGRKIIAETFDVIGPHVPATEMRFAGNELSCKNCHLNSGLKEFAAPYVGVTKRFPNFRKRENKEGTIEERINGCMERSMNGKPLPIEGREMQAIVSYMEWLGHLTDSSGKIIEKGFVEPQYPSRAVDIAQGKKVYDQSCIACHGEGGLGKKLASGRGYQFPPLAGEDSYNNGAGMHRVLTAMAFIKSNMPLGATAEVPFLSDDDSYDVAGYINSLQRPIKEHTLEDYPDKKLKPMSSPYPPYEDDFSREQHKFGPFKPIFDFYLTKWNVEKKK